MSAHDISMRGMRRCMCSYGRTAHSMFGYILDAHPITPSPRAEYMPSWLPYTSHDPTR